MRDNKLLAHAMSFLSQTPQQHEAEITLKHHVTRKRKHSSSSFTQLKCTFGCTQRVPYCEPLSKISQTLVFCQRSIS